MPASGAVAVELQPVPLDLVPRSVRQLPHEITDRALVEVADAAAAGANKVVVVLGSFRDPIVQTTVVEEDAAHDAEVGQQADRAENGGAAGAAAAVEEIVDSEVARLLKDCRDNGAPRRCYAMAARFEFEGDGFQV